MPQTCDKCAQSKDSGQKAGPGAGSIKLVAVAAGVISELPSGSREAVNDGGTPAPVPDAGLNPVGPTVANEGDECAPDGARTCVEEGSRAPLECSEGTWRPAPMCGAAELCDTTPGAQRGMCREIASVCQSRQTNVPFCDREVMRVSSSFWR